MDSMKRALFAWRSALSASTSLRSFASHSEFQLANATPAPVQKTCSHGSVRGLGFLGDRVSGALGLGEGRRGEARARDGGMGRGDARDGACGPREASGASRARLRQTLKRADRGSAEWGVAG